MMEIEHAVDYEAIRRPVMRRGILQLAPGQSPSGYGRKISTDYMIRFRDDPRKRLHRVYCVCYSNSGSLYVIRGGRWLFIRNHELEEALEAHDATRHEG